MLRYIAKAFHTWQKTRRTHSPIITVEINKRRLLDNVQALREIAPQWQIAPVLKSNAYGHDLVTVAGIVEETSPAFICVDSYPEAETIRHAGIKTPILIMGFTPTPTIRAGRLSKTAFTITSLEQLREIADASVTIHLKFDTGMHRRGIEPSALQDVLNVITEASCAVEGIMSHFAESEKASDVTKRQISEWNALVAQCKTLLPDVKYYHLANSGGFAYHDKIDANVGRTGLAMYGINPGNLKCELQPVLEMKSIVTEVRTLHAGESVGYSGTYTATRDIKTAVIPVGYFEGLDRRLSNKGIYTAGSATLPIIGRVSMNMSCCDASAAPKLTYGDTITIISADATQANSVVKMAEICETVPYELLVRIPAGLRRVVV